MTLDFELIFSRKMAESEKLNDKKGKFSEFDDVWNVLPHFRFVFLRERIITIESSAYQLLITGIAGYISMVGGLCALYPVFGQWSSPHRCQMPVDDLSFSQTAEIQNALEIDSCETVYFQIPANCTELLLDKQDLRRCITRELNGSEIETFECEPENFIYNMEAIGQSSEKNNLLFRSVSHFLKCFFFL